MKILLLGDDTGPRSVLDFLKSSKKYTIQAATTIETAEKLIKTSRPDFVVCAGRIQKNDRGEFYLEI